MITLALVLQLPKLISEQLHDDAPAVHAQPEEVAASCFCASNKNQINTV